MIRPIRRAFPALLCLAIVALLPLAAPMLNGLRPAGVPLGTWMTAQGLPLLLLAVLAMWARGGRGHA